MDDGHGRRWFRRRRGSPAGADASDASKVPDHRRTVLLQLAADAAIRTCGGHPVPTADPFAVLEHALTMGVRDAGYDEALDALQARLRIRGYPCYRPLLPHGLHPPGEHPGR